MVQTYLKEVRYERYASNQLILYRLCNGISTLCAGFALFVGYKIAYASDILVTGIQIGVLLSLREIHLNHTGAERKQALFEKNKALYEAKWGAWQPHAYRPPAETG